jgi:hypothetical protein
MYIHKCVTWDPPKAILNRDKHGVSFEEAATVFLDANALDWDDEGHSRMEERRKRIGKSAQQRIVLVVYTTRRTNDGQETIRIISARQASRKEREAYSR